MENDSLPFASCHFALCSQTRIKDCHLPIIIHQNFPPSEEHTNRMGRAHQRHHAPARHSLNPAERRQTPGLTAPPGEADGSRFLPRPRQRSPASQTSALSHHGVTTGCPLPESEAFLRRNINYQVLKQIKPNLFLCPFFSFGIDNQREKKNGLHSSSEVML